MSCDAVLYFTFIVSNEGMCQLQLNFFWQQNVILFSKASLSFWRGTAPSEIIMSCDAVLYFTFIVSNEGMCQLQLNFFWQQNVILFSKASLRACIYLNACMQYNELNTFQLPTVHIIISLHYVMCYCMW